MSRAWRGLVWLVATEARMYVGLVRLLARRPDVPEGATAHRYVGAVAALLWGFTGVSAVELVVLHLVIPWEPVRIAADVIGIWGLVWCLGLTGCHHVYPHLADTRGLRVRAAHRRAAVELAWADVAGVSVRERSHDSSRAVQVEHGPDGPVLLVVVGSRTNLDLRLAAPVPVVLRGASYDVVEVRVLADDPEALRATWAGVSQPAGGT